MRLVTFDPHYGCSFPFEDLFDDFVKINRRDYFDFEPTDVFLFEGGTDVNPMLYGEERSKYTAHPDWDRDTDEREFFLNANSAGSKMLGICRGAQFLCVQNGGSLIQHINGHTQSHDILTDKELRYRVTSTHHQMMAPSGNFELIAWSEYPQSDFYLGENETNVKEKLKITNYREPEIVFFPDTKSLCIQSHPEYLPLNDPFVLYCRDLVKEKLFK